MKEIVHILSMNNREMLIPELYKQLEMSFDEFAAILFEMKQNNIIDLIFVDWVTVRLCE